MSELGMTITTIATQIAQAVAKDQSPPEFGGCDPSAGLFGPNLSRVIREIAQQIVSPAPAVPTPIDMVLHCPACGLQHIDARETVNAGPDERGRRTPTVVVWDNPPHRSHLCGGCGHIWRPSDLPTNGVKTVKTKGKNDSPTAEARSFCGGHPPLDQDFDGEVRS